MSRPEEGKHGLDSSGQSKGPLRRLRKASDAKLTTARSDEADSELAEKLESLSLGPKALSKFNAAVAARRPIADWSDDDSEDESSFVTAASSSSSSQGSSPPADSANARQQTQPHKAFGEPLQGPAPNQNLSEPARPIPLPDAEVGSSLGIQGQDASGPPLVLGPEGQFTLAANIASRLYSHQVEGVRWLWSLYMMKQGGILGDDMGLGKTLQCSAFLAGMLQSKLLKRALVVAPKTLLAQWRKELAICGLQHCTHELAPSASQHERSLELEAVFFRPGVLLTTYGMVQHNIELFCTSPIQQAEQEPVALGHPLWDFMILDEGHKIKNSSTQIYKQLRSIPQEIAVIITGTPIQNNLMEYFVLFDFVSPGLLGNQRFFKLEYEKVITRGNRKDVTLHDRELASSRSKALRDQCGPHFLRREKKDVFRERDELAASELAGPAPRELGRKNDFVVWLQLRPQQKRIYEAFLNSQAVKDALNQSKSPLAAITVLKKICVHPNLLSERAVEAVAKGGQLPWL